MNGDRMNLRTLTESAIVMHEMFLSLVAGGFTEEQALRLVVLLVQQSGESE